MIDKNDLRFGYEIESLPPCEFSRTQIYDYMYEYGYEISQHYDNDNVWEIKTTGGLTFEDIIQHFSILSEKLKILHFKSCEEGGIHIHISLANSNIRDYLSSILLQYINNENTLYKICSNTKTFDNSMRHRYNGYCQSLSTYEPDDYDDDEEAGIIYGIYDNHEYGICYNSSFNTVEFRLIDTGFNIDRFISILTMLSQMTVYCINNPIKRFDLNNADFYSCSSRNIYNIAKVQRFLGKIKVNKKIKDRLYKLYNRTFAQISERVPVGV